MPLSTVLATKDLNPAPQPLLLAEFQFIDGSMLYLSTHPLNTTEGGYSYGGNNYLARIDSHAISALAARSEQGIDRIPSVSIPLHDSDRTLYSNYERGGPGFRGAILTLRLLFWSADTTDYSSDSWVPFIGIVDQIRYERQGRADMLVVSANAGRNMARAMLPVFHVQQRCGNVFPRNAAERLAGATDMSHKCWGCGYDPDQAGTDPEIGGDARRGSTGSSNQVLADGTIVTDGAGIYVSCAYTVQDCKARGMYAVDASSRATGRFTGDTWQPDKREYQSKSYLQGKTVTVLQQRNDAAYQQSYPMLYGAQWVKPVILNVPADANSTRFEAVICQDDVGNDGIVQVVVNGVIVPRNGSSPDNAIFRWNWFGDPALGTAYHTGSRNGVPTHDVPWSTQDGGSDPHGSLAGIEAVVYSQVAQAGSVPQCQVLALGPKIKIPDSANPSAQGSWPKARTTNPAWVMLDVMIWANYRYAEIDLASFIAEAPYCDVSVSYLDFAGNTASHARFKSQFVLEAKRSGADVLAALLRGFNAQLNQDPQTGRVGLMIRKTLADQQPSAIAGSNYSNGISSKHANGTAGTGYVAYHFSEASIARQGPDDPPFLRWWTDAVAQTPNKIVFPFQDEDNSFATDSISVVDVDAVNRAGGYISGENEIVEQLNVLGISNFDQGIRICNTYVAEKWRGNPRSDTGGTVFVEIRADFRVLHLRKGQLIAVSWQAYGWDKQLFRVQSIAPSTNWEGATITASWHSDDWYTDVFGQRGASQSTNATGKPARQPYAWQPASEQPVSGDSLLWTFPGYSSGTWLGMSVAQSYAIAKDGSAVANLSVHGCAPVNVLSDSTRPPLMGILGTANGTGGVIRAAREYFIAVAAIDADGNQSALSKIVKCVTPAGADTCTISTPSISWFGGSVGYIVYAGTDQNNLSAQALSPNTTPSTITLTSLNLETFGPPDPIAERLSFDVRRCGAKGSQPVSYGHAGVWGDAVVEVTANTLTFGYSGMSALPDTTGLPDAGILPDTGGSGAASGGFVGCDLMLVALPKGDTGKIPLANFRISASTASGTSISFTVSPDPAALGILPGSVFVCMSVPSASSTATTIVDVNWANAWNGGTGLAPDAERGNTVRILLGTGQYFERTISTNGTTSVTWDDPLPVVPDSTTRYIIETPSVDYSYDTGALTTARTPITVPHVATLGLANFDGQTVIVRAHVVDSDGNRSLNAYAPWRIVYLWGDSGNNMQGGPIASWA